MLILIDNGHGAETAGKRSPDGRLREWSYAREIAVRLEAALKEKGMDAMRVVPEDRDVPLTAGADSRVGRVNALCAGRPASDTLLVSIHCNAAGNGSQWMTARGWSAHVSPNASYGSRRLALALIRAAEAAGLTVRRHSRQTPWWPQDLAVCRDTKCPAVLTENLFQDNRRDVDFLLSEEGKETITELHLNGIMTYVGEAWR